MDSSHGPVGRTGPFSLFSFRLVGATVDCRRLCLKRRGRHRFRGRAGWQSGYAAACKAVDAGSIPTPASITGSLSGKTPPDILPAPNQAQVRGPSLACHCVSRWELLVAAMMLLAGVGTAVATETPRGDERERLGVGLDCQWGYQRSGEACVQVRVPANAHLNAFGNDWECNQGYMKRAAECAPVNVPPNARINIEGNDWECDRGYRRSGSVCVPLSRPPNAQPGTRENDWQCDRGFRRSGSTCVPIRVPLNGRLSPRGNDWECRPGYRRIGPRCEP